MTLHRLAFALLLAAPGVAPGHSPLCPPLHAEVLHAEALTLAAAAQDPDLALDENRAYRESPVVEKLGSLLGMKPPAAAATFTIFNFLVLFAALAYGLLKALPKAFRARSSSIQKDLVDARTATEQASARLSSVEARLSKLDEQIAAMRTQAEADSARDQQRIRDGVEEEKARILAAAQAEIQAAGTQARRELQTFAAELAIEQAARSLVITAETDRLLVENFAHRLGTTHGGEN